MALKAFISTELRKIVSKDSSVEKLTTPEAMLMWASAFTHISITGVPGQNYEGLETKGDAFLAIAFFSYIDTILPIQERTPVYYTDLRRFWLSKPELAKFSDELGLFKFIKFDPSIMDKPDVNLKEDVFEAFFGAMFTIFDKLIGGGTGYLYSYNYLSKFLWNKDILLPPEQVFPSKTRLKELFDGLKWGTARYISKGNPNADQITVHVLDPQGDTLGIGTARDRQGAENQAAVNAIANLASANPPITMATLASNRPVDRELEEPKARISAFLSRRGKYGPLELVRIYKGTGSDPIFIVELRTTQDFGTARAMKVALGTAQTREGDRRGDKDVKVRVLNEYIRLHNIA